MAPKSIVAQKAQQDLFFKARMTQIQFASLGIRCRRKHVLRELRPLQFRRTLSAARNIDLGLVAQWLVNGWNTEYLLRANATALEGEGLRYSLQWAFPQAYYSVFATATAFFRAVGFTESSHARVIAKTAELMSQ